MVVSVDGASLGGVVGIPKAPEAIGYEVVDENPSRELGIVTVDVCSTD